MPGKEYLCDEVLNTLLDFHREQEQKQKREQEQNARLSKKIKRIIKFILPYGVVHFIQQK
jgi:hypothetical protein